MADRSDVGFARKTALTISFVERGFERLGLDRLAVGFSWRSYKVRRSSPLEYFSWRWAGRLSFLAIFPPALSFRFTYFSFYTRLRPLPFIHV